jgi:hypothetical protein
MAQAQHSFDPPFRKSPNPFTLMVAIYPPAPAPASPHTHTHPHPPPPTRCRCPVADPRPEKWCSSQVSRFQGTVARSEHKCYLFRTSTKHLSARRREDSQDERGKNVLGLETKLRLRSQRYITTVLNTGTPRGFAPPSSYSS